MIGKYGVCEESWVDFRDWKRVLIFVITNWVFIVRHSWQPNLSFFCRTLVLTTLSCVETATSGIKQPKFGWRTENRCHPTRWRYRMNIRTLGIPAEVLLCPICRFHIMDILLRVPWWVLLFFPPLLTFIALSQSKFFLNLEILVKVMLLQPRKRVTQYKIFFANYLLIEFIILFELLEALKRLGFN